MAKGNLELRQIQLGDNADTSKNFVISVPAVADGTLTIERENGTDVLTVDAAGKLSFTAADNQLPLGVGQTWQDVSSNRVFATNYTNTTARPIQVSVYVESTGAGQTASLIVDGLTVALAGSTGAVNNGGYSQLTCVVPAGSIYQVTSSAAARGWKELR